MCECAPGYYAGPGLADVDGAACARVAVQSTEGNLVLEVPAGKDVNIHVGNARLTSIGDMVQDIATTSEALDAAKTDLSTRINSARDDLKQTLKSADSALEARLEAADLSLKTGLEASLQATDSQLRSIIDSVRTEASTGIARVSQTLTSVNNNLGREVSANKASTITNRQALSTLEAKVAKASDSPPFEFFKDCGAYAAALSKKLSQNDRLKFKAQKKLTMLCSGNPNVCRPAICYVQPPTQKLLSQRRPAYQSRWGWGAPASRANDGNTNGNWGARSTTHTHYDHGAWWQVDLGRTFQITELRIWGRTDCCQWRLRTGQFWIKGSRDPWRGGTMIRSNGGNTFGNFGNGQRYANSGTSSKMPMSGRWVGVRLSGRDYLSIAELRVWGIDGNGALRGSEVNP